jgi:hypothetical protein
LTEIANDPERMNDFMTRFEEQPAAHGDVLSRSSALMRILKGITDFVARSNPQALDRILDNLAQAATRLSPELILQLLAESRTPGSDGAHLVAELTIRMSDPMIARFVARSVATERGCTARLAEAFRALAPTPERQRSIVDLARTDVEDPSEVMQVLPHRQVGVDGRRLCRVRDGPAERRCPRRKAQHGDLARVEALHADDGAHQCRLAAATRP